MLLSAVSVLVVAQSSSEIPEGLMNNPVLYICNTAAWTMYSITLQYTTAAAAVAAQLHCQYEHEGGQGTASR